MRQQAALDVFVLALAAAVAHAAAPASAGVVVTLVRWPYT